ncbi:Uncharacterised protein [uncultured archaeon]|nr:Uncharacterised protein [uncultured archaeon]
MPARKKTPYNAPLLEHPVYSEGEIKRVKIGSEEFKVPVKRIRGEAEGQDHLLILGVLQNRKLKMPSTGLHAQLIQEVKKQFGGSVDDSRIHILKDNDAATNEFVKKAFEPIYTSKSTNEVKFISKSNFLKQFNALANKNSEIKNSKHAKLFLRTLIGVHENDSLPVDEVQGFYKLLLRERLDKIKQAIPPKQLTGRKVFKQLTGRSIKGLLTGKKITDENYADLVEDKVKKPAETKKDGSKQKTRVNFSQNITQTQVVSNTGKEEKTSSKEHEGGVNVKVTQGGMGGIGGGPYSLYSYKPPEHEPKKEDPLLKPKPVNTIAFAALILVIILILGIIFSN